MKQIKNIKSYLLSGYLGTLSLVALATCLYVDASMLRPDRMVVGASMAPNIMPGSTIKSSIFFSQPKRNEIYVINIEMLTQPKIDHQTGDYIKRVVGVPGDKLSFDISTGKFLSINGREISSIKDENLKTHLIRSKKSETKGTQFELVPHLTNVLGDKFHIYEAGNDAFKNDEKMKEFISLVFTYPWLRGMSPENRIAIFSIPEGFYFVLSDNRVMGTDSRHFGLVPEAAFEYKYNM